MSDVSPKPRLIVVLCVATGIFVVAMLVFRSLGSVDSPWVPKCALHHLTGLHCPGCGTTRAIHALANGRFGDAIRFNPLLILGLPAILGAISFQRRRERRGQPAWPGLAWTCVAVLLVYSVARNVPSPERAWLAPPAVAAEAYGDVAIAGAAGD